MNLCASKAFIILKILPTTGEPRQTTNLRLLYAQHHRTVVTRYDGKVRLRADSGQLAGDQVEYVETLAEFHVVVTEQNHVGPHHHTKPLVTLTRGKNKS